MNYCVVGLQWGDEGKGKVVDILAEKADIVVRYNGGANAGHTVTIGDPDSSCEKRLTAEHAESAEKKLKLRNSATSADSAVKKVSGRFALHLLPSGSVRPNTICVIANGVVVDPEVLIKELETLQEKNITLKGRLFISENAHIVLDYHKKEDQLREQSLGKDKLGTTVRGIGPCYADKVGRNHAVRIADLRDLENLKAKLRTIVEYKNKVFAAVYNAEPTSFDEIFEKCKSYADKLTGFITDTTEFLHRAIASGKSVIFEGAQGTLLDLDHGTFPYVTSSNSSPLGQPSGSGVPARMIGKFVGVAKAYTTRVGAGPFPAEQDNPIGQYIRDKGNEYGTTTGRPRRCGWFDAVAVSYSVTIGSVDSIALMHLDTLSGLKEIKICSRYKIDGEEKAFFPTDAARLSRAACVYETLPGWDEDITEAADFHDLPLNAQNYICRIEELVKRPITIIGVGPKRSQTIFR